MWRTLALGLVVFAFAAQVKAAPSGSAECAQFRQNILDMENTSVRPPGWIQFDSQLRATYAQQCILSPSRKVADGYWFKADGSPLGIRGDYTPPGWDLRKVYRPDGGAFITTPEIAAFCAKTTNPSMCAMVKGIEADCAAPADTQERNYCKSILNGQTPDLPQASEPLPPIADLIGPARAAAPQMSDAQIQADPGFQKMCEKANENWSKCALQRQNIASLGAPGLGSNGQAGAFYECQQLYGGVLNMCAAPKLAAAAPNKPIPVNPPPKPAPPQQAKPPSAKPPPNPGLSQAPPPPPSSQMSPQCQQLVSNYVSAAQANDGPRSLAGYNALKGAGGCGVLAKVDRPMPQPQAAPAEDPRFIARGATPLSDQVVGGCDASPAECQRRVQQLRAGVSPEAQAALFMNAVSIGLQLGAAVANGMAAAMPQGGGTNMNSIGNKPVQHTYGQGAPTYRTPRNSPSDITGTK